MAAFRLKLLGGVVLEGPEGPVRGPATQRRRLALLARLALSTDGSSSREALMACLWPESDTEHARHALSNSLYVIRKTFGDDAIVSRGDELRLNLERVEVDAVDLETAARDGDDEAVAGLYRGPLMDGFHLGEASEFERWLDGRRDRLARAHDEALERLARQAVADGRTVDAVRWLRRLVADDPLNTRVALRLMEALAAAGDPANAVEHGEEHVALLESELGMEPPSEVVRMIERLRAPAAPPASVGREAGDAAPSSEPARVAAPPPEPAQLAAPEPAKLAPPSPEPARVVPPPLPFSDVPTDFAPLPPFVGRSAALARLHRHLEPALEGRGRPVFLTGEAGTGKTALAREFCRQALERHPDLVLAGGRGNAYTGAGDAYQPFREILALLTGDLGVAGTERSLTRGQAARMLDLLPETGAILALHGPDLPGTILGAESLVERARTRAPGASWVDELASRARLRPAGPGPVGQQADLIRQYVRVLHELALRHPLLLVLDDLQWADSGSIGLFFQLGREVRTNRILLLGLYRASEVALGRDGDRHPLEPVLHELVRRYGDVEIPLLQTGDRAFVDALLDVDLNRLDEAFREALFERTRGHALFTVELLRTMRESGRLVRDDECCWHASPELRWEGLPARVEAVIAERIDRLPGTQREALVVASVEGEEFTAEAVAAVCRQEVDEVIAALGRDLERRHHLVTARGMRRVAGRRLSRYRFRHVLFQQYLYDRLDAAERASLHESLGLALERLHGDRADDEAVALAHHFFQAGLEGRASRYLRTAGLRAMRSGALREALGHLETAATGLLTLPASPERDRREMELQIALGNVRHLVGAGGLRTADEAYARGRELAERLGDDEQLFWALVGLILTRGVMQGDLRLGGDLAERCLSLAEEAEDPVMLVYALEAVGRNAIMRGRFRTTVERYQRLLSVFDRSERGYATHHTGVDVEPLSRAMVAMALWPLGYPDQALEWALEAIGAAREAEDRLCLLYALWLSTPVHLWRGDISTGRMQLEELARVANEMGIGLWDPPTRIALGWCLARGGRVEEGIETATDGLSRHLAMGLMGWMPVYRTLVAEALALGGRVGQGLEALDEALRDTETYDDRTYEAEVHRMRGELLLALPRPDPAQAEAAFREAVAVARRQEARSFELRATTSLARLLRGQGRTDEARTTLSRIYGWFTEGFDTADLQAASALLGELDGA